MPAWEGLLSPAQRWALVWYVKDFCEVFLEEEPDAPIEIPKAPPETAALVWEGKYVYAMLGCRKCHGDRGRGDGPSARELVDDWGWKIRPYDFTRGDYKNGSTPSDVYRTLVTGLNGTPMPALEPQIVAYPGGSDVDIGELGEVLESSVVEELRVYLEIEPTAAELQQMSPLETEILVQRRLWALVYYLRSLHRPKGFLYRLFVENPELRGNHDNDS
jgi:mono/diheme cytochrome c family protein